jgi:hypothetical protein
MLSWPARWSTSDGGPSLSGSRGSALRAILA